MAMILGGLVYAGTQEKDTKRARNAPHRRAVRGTAFISSLEEEKNEGMASTEVR
jgi:hypothetical protein